MYYCQDLDPIGENDVIDNFLTRTARTSRHTTPYNSGVDSTAEDYPNGVANLRPKPARTCPRSICIF